MSPADYPPQGDMARTLAALRKDNSDQRKRIRALEQELSYYRQTAKGPSVADQRCADDALRLLQLEGAFRRISLLFAARRIDEGRARELFAILDSIGGKRPQALPDEQSESLTEDMRHWHRKALP